MRTADPPTLHTLICSTRPGRVGDKLARWFHQRAAARGSFDARLVDLADFALPVFDEPKHPRLRQYEHAHTQRWSESVSAADAFVFVTPEYNYGPPPSLVNAMNYLVHEWAYKPVGFVSYGGLSGGMRAVVAEKQLATTLRMVPIFEAVAVPMVQQRLAPEGFQADATHDTSADALLDELLKWATALKAMR